MDTKIFNFYEDKQSFWHSVDVIKNNGVVVFPTETVYGIGANALSIKGVSNIFKVKGRAKDNPLIVHVCNKDISNFVENVSEHGKILIDKFWPGPLTIIFRKKSIIPYETTGGLETVAIRMPNNEIALNFIKECGVPIAAPSANISGRPSGTNAIRCFEDLSGKVSYIIDGLDSKIGIESTVIDLTLDIPTILRPGYITLKDIKEVLPNAVMYREVNEKFLKESPRSPGMKYRHYAPRGDMIIVNSTKDKIANYVNSKVFEYRKIGILCVKENENFYNKVCRDTMVVTIGSKHSAEEIGKNLFESIRKFDDCCCDFIVSEWFYYDEKYEAIANRLLKSASHKIIIL